MEDAPSRIGQDLADLVLGIDHVGVAVANLDEAVRRFEALLGLRVVHAERNDEQGVVEAMLARPEGTEGQTQLQLLAPLGSDSPVARFLDRRGPGLQHLAVRVRDIDRATAVLTDRGVRLIYDSPRTGTRGSRINFVHPTDAGGVLIELVEHPHS